MKILRICLAQINPIVGDLAGNSAKIINYIEKARHNKADIVVFPELSLSGYPPEDLLLKPHFIRDNKKELSKIIKASKSIFTIVGAPYSEKNKIFNAAVLINNGKLVNVYKKIYLPNYGVFDEKRYFHQGDTCNVVAFNKDARIGINICEDIWYAEGPQRTQAILGKAGVIINISASPYYTQKIEHREEILEQRARENNAYILYCNLAGGQDELIFDGGSSVFDNKGRLIARAKQFEEDLITVDLDLRDLKPKNISGKDKIIFCLPKESLKIDFLPGLKNKGPLAAASRIEKKLGVMAEVYTALMLGLKDYVKKNNFKKVVLGLSGGIDSALVAALAADALGAENVIALTMPSQYSSDGTKEDARRIAENLNIKLITVPITEIYEKYIVSLKSYFRGYESDIAEQNIQARIRGNLLMAFSNKFGWLVINTGNKSEISTGYCTLYGDMAGGFSVLKDVPKGLVYKLSEYRNKLQIKEIIPESVIKRPPSAELKIDQKDQDILPPYALLDKIIDLYIEKDVSAEDIIKKGFNKNIVNKVIYMIDRNEYKRRQSAPGIKITPKAFGRDRRMPITNVYFG